jgi:hypothetical protein
LRTSIRRSPKLHLIPIDRRSISRSPLWPRLDVARSPGGWSRSGPLPLNSLPTGYNSSSLISRSPYSIRTNEVPCFPHPSHHSHSLGLTEFFGGIEQQPHPDEAEKTEPCPSAFRKSPSAHPREAKRRYSRRHFSVWHLRQSPSTPRICNTLPRLLLSLSFEVWHGSVAFLVLRRAALLSRASMTQLSRVRQRYLLKIAVEKVKKLPLSHIGCVFSTSLVFSQELTRLA